MVTLPLSGLSSPAISRSVVVFPAPVGPSRTTNSPSATTRSSALIAWFSLKRLETLRSVTSAMRSSLEQRGLEGPPRAALEERQVAAAERQPDRLSGHYASFSRDPGLYGAVCRFDDHDLRRAQVLGSQHLAPELAIVVEADVLGADAQRKVGGGVIVVDLGDRNIRPQHADYPCSPREA